MNAARTASPAHRAAAARRSGCARLLALACALQLALSWLACGGVLAQTLRTHQRVLLITQTVSEPAAGVRSTVSARVGALAFAAGGLATGQGVETIADASSLAQATVRDFGDTLGSAQLLALADGHFAAQSAAIAESLRRTARDRGVTQATFVFDQAVRVTGSTQPRQLVWTLSVDSAGRASFPRAQLFDRQPTLLQVQYVPLRVAAGLPAGWAYPDGGVLRWQLLNLQLQPVGAALARDTAGAFDAPDDTSGSPIDPQAGLRCLIDRRARADCPPGLPDIISLIDQNAAIGALLDYGQRLAPVYDTVSNAAGGFDQVARVSMRVDLREVTYGGCSADISYRNAGQYGFALQAVNDRYRIAPDGGFARIDQSQTVALSPTLAFDVMRALPPQPASALTGWLLDPQDPQRALLQAADIANLQYLAPITTRGEQEQTIVSHMPVSGELSRLQVDVRCSVAGVWTVRSTIAPWSQCRSGNCNSDYFAYEATFTPGTASSGPYRLTARTWRGAWWEPQQLQFDGSAAFTLWHAAWTGCNPLIGARFALSGQYLGAVGFEECPAAAPAQDE